MTERTLVRIAEVGLALITLAAVLGMGRLFAGGGWLGPLAANAIAAHLLSAFLRRRGLSVALAAPVMAAGAALVISWTCAWSTTLVGLPTGDTIDALRADLDVAWGAYQDVIAPTPVLTGFLIASALAIWCIAFVADWAAFRLWVPFESTLPAATLFLFTALLGTDRGRAWAVAVYAGSMLAFLLVHRLARQEGTTHWVAERRAAGHRSLLVAGAALTVLAVAAGALLGPALPGADASGILDPRDLDGEDAPRVTISPLVDIRSRLVDQSDVEVFTVRSNERAYWRLTSLERFDGRIWSSSGSYGKADGDLPEEYPIDAPTADVEQTFSITNLAAIWLPSAYEARSFSGDDLDVRYDESSGTLIVSSDIPTSDGITYQVSSTSPRLTPDDLTATVAQVPQQVREQYLGLPADFSPVVRQIAADITADASTPYEQSRALQDYLRTFTYDLTVQPGHGGDALEEFLVNTKRGYCEQFAGAFAAMARAIGLPARVAVGFTPGAVDPADPQLFHVRGENAHAWPEVYFAGAGWVAFEPTPGRGMPAAEPYTGVPEQQQVSGQVVEVPVDTVPNGGPSTTVPGGGDDGGQDGDTGDSTTTTAPRARSGGDDDGSILRDWLLDPAKRIVPLLLALLLLYCGAVPAALVAHRRRRRARATTPEQRIEVAWLEAVEDAGLVGFLERPADTYAERAVRLAESLPTAEAGALALAQARERADYSPDGAGPADVALADEGAAAVAAAVRAVMTRGDQARRWLDPRPQLRAWRRAQARDRRRIETSTAVDREPDRPLVGADRSEG